MIAQVSNSLLNLLHKLAQTPTTCDLQSRLSGHKKTPPLSKTSARFPAKEFFDNLQFSADRTNGNA